VNIDVNAEAAVREVFEDLFSSEYRNAQERRSLWVPSPDTSAVGTAAKEIAFGVDAIDEMEQRINAEALLDYTIENMDVTVHEKVAWVLAAVVGEWVADGETQQMSLRVTAVLEEYDGHWLVAHLHKSVPDPRVPEGLSFPTSMESIAISVRADRPELEGLFPTGTVTIVFSDIEDSTELNVALGDTRYVELLREHNEIIRDCVAEHFGQEVKNEGDSFMLVFGSAKNTVSCAIEFQRRLARRNEGAEHPILVRAGVHTGEPVREADDFFGTQVVMASRIASRATGGEVLVSSLLRELVESSGDFQFEARRPVTLKGLSGRHRLHRVTT